MSKAKKAVAQDAAMVTEGSSARKRLYPHIKAELKVELLTTY